MSQAKKAKAAETVKVLPWEEGRRKDVFQKLCVGEHAAY